jgi:hypothetical protein
MRATNLASTIGSWMAHANIATEGKGQLETRVLMELLPFGDLDFDFLVGRKDRVVRVLVNGGSAGSGNHDARSTRVRRDAATVSTTTGGLRWGSLTAEGELTAATTELALNEIGDWGVDTDVATTDLALEMGIGDGRIGTDVATRSASTEDDASRELGTGAPLVAIDVRLDIGMWLVLHVVGIVVVGCRRVVVRWRRKSQRFFEGRDDVGGGETLGNESRLLHSHTERYPRRRRAGRALEW